MSYETMLYQTLAYWIYMISSEWFHILLRYNIFMLDLNRCCIRFHFTIVYTMLGHIILYYAHHAILQEVT